jgi:hypothetical protein
LIKIHDETLAQTKSWFAGSSDFVRKGIVDHYGQLPDTEQDYWNLPNGPTWLWWVLNTLPIDPPLKVSMLGCVNFFRLQGIKVYWRPQFPEYLGTLSLKFQKARTKIEVVLSLPSWLSQLNWDSYQGRLRTTSILVRAFWNFKLKVLKYSRNCSLHNTLIPWSLKNPESPNVHTLFLLKSSYEICQRWDIDWSEWKSVVDSKQLLGLGTTNRVSWR